MYLESDLSLNRRPTLFTCVETSLLSKMYVLSFIIRYSIFSIIHVVQVVVG